MLASSLAPTFDALAAEVPDVLREAWKGIGAKDSGRSKLEASIYLIGYSTAAAKFVAYRFLREHDFDTEVVSDELHVTPSPLSMRPQKFELDRMAAAVGIPDDARTAWLAQPKPPLPADLGDWGELGLRVRYERAVPNHPGKTFVGGKLVHTRIERDLVQTIVLTEYDDDGAEFAQMVAGTRHPLAQHGPCPCGSGNTSLTCCMVEMLDQDCGCGKPGSEDKSFRDCCMAPPIEEVSKAGVSSP
jgi:hypothetical protein